MKEQNQETSQKSSYCLPAGTRLNQRYVLKRVLGEGGFGITYLGWDEVLAMPVAVKEYYPSSMAGREMQGNNTYQVRALGSQRREAYEKGKEAFLKEARVLSRFCQLEGIVLVRDFFQENGTAYIVMEYIDGISIKEYVQTKGAFSVEKALELMKPVLLSLHAIHGKNLIHRDLSPDNILVTSQGKLKLIDFGAARHAGTGTQKTITVMFKRGFAALEQYQAKGEQGVWTDVYGISATMYYMMSGKVPEESVSRVLKDSLVELKKLPEIGISEVVSDGIHRGMTLEWEKRYQNIAQLYQVLYSEEIPEVAFSDVENVNEEATFLADSEISQSSKPDTDKSSLETEVLSEELAMEMSHRKRTGIGKKWMLVIAMALVVVVTGILIYQGQQSQNKNDVKLEQSNGKDEQSEALKQLENNEQSSQQSEALGRAENDVQETKQPEENKMPDLIGKRLEKAKKSLRKLGVENIRIKRQYSQKVEKGKVLHQSIPAGKVLTDKTVVLTISKGKKPAVTRPTVAPSTPQTTSAGSKQKEQVAGSLDSLLD